MSYASQLQADRIADHIEAMINSADELWLEYWTDVEKTEFGTLLVHTQDSDGETHIFEVNVKERIVDELNQDEPEVDPDARRDADQDR